MKFSLLTEADAHVLAVDGRLWLQGNDENESGVQQKETEMRTAKSVVMSIIVVAICGVMVSGCMSSRRNNRVDNRTDNRDDRKDTRR